MAAEGYIALFRGEDSPEAKAAALRLQTAIEVYLARCEAESKRAKGR